MKLGLESPNDKFSRGMLLSSPLGTESLLCMEVRAQEVRHIL